MDESATQRAPKVTVLMSVHDEERYLREAIDSILAQSFSDFEFLILDDASTDSSRAIVRGYDDSRIRMIENERNLGLTRSLNRGIELARGTYIARMDADDLSKPERLGRQVAFLDAHSECAAVASYSAKIDRDSIDVGRARTPIDGDEIRKRLRRRNCITHGTVMMRREALQRVGCYDEAMERAQDYDLWLRLSEDHCICTIPELLYLWRQHGESVSVQHLEEQDRFAEMAKHNARVRRVAKLLSTIDRDGLSPRRGAGLVIEAAREEEESRLPAPAGGGFLARVRRRFPRLSVHAYALFHPRSVREARRVLREYAAGGLDSEAARAALLGIIEADPAPTR
jgi:glycosyltransferase involved in cell wall biosynthesis